jgi:Holliday junction DNA helicase RuvB
MLNAIEWLGGFVSYWFNTEKEPIKQNIDQDHQDEGLDEQEPLQEPPTPIELKAETKQTGPLSFSSFIGNESVVERLQLAIKAAQKENRVLPHILLYGQPGLGKTTLAKIIAKEIGKHLVEITGSTIKNQADLFKILMEIDATDGILFVDEVADINKAKELPETSWLPLLQDFIFLHNLQDKTITYNSKEYAITTSKAIMRPFTIIGATTDPGDLTDAFRERFPITCVLYPYSVKDLEDIIKLHSEIRKIKISKDAISSLATRVRDNPRIAVNYLRNCNDRAIVENDYIINKDIVLKQMSSQGVDEIGITREDIMVLKVLAEHPKGLGVKSLAGIANLRSSTIENIIEPFLKRLNFMKTTHRRFITEKGKIYLETFK